MSGLIVLTITQTFIALLLILFGWLIKYKEKYALLSGFNTRPEEEQRMLIEIGYPQKVGALLFYIGVGMLLLLPLSFTSFSYSMEVQIGFMILFLFGGLIHLTKYDLPHKRKKSYAINISLFVIVIGSIGAISFFSYQGYELKLSDEKFEITGMYGDEWETDQIENMQLLDSMPEVTRRTNGVGLPTLSKGKFNVVGHENSLLFIQNGVAPILLIQLNNQSIFINDKDPAITEAWFESLQMAVKES